MQGGDLDNRLPPRWLFVFEGVIANVPAERQREYRVAMRFSRWKRAASCYVLEPHVRKVLWDLMWRRDYRFDIITFLGEPMVDVLTRMLEREQIPFSNMWSVTEDTLAERLAFMPDVMYVIHADPVRHLTYGNRGLLVTDPDRLTLA